MIKNDGRKMDVKRTYAETRKLHFFQILKICFLFWGLEGKYSRNETFVALYKTNKWSNYALSFLLESQIYYRNTKKFACIIQACTNRNKIIEPTELFMKF